MASVQPACTVYFDGACPLCSQEIAHYRRAAGADDITWVDAAVSDPASLGPGLTREAALARMHVRRADGSVSMDQKGIDCLSGPLLGSPRSVLLAAPRVVFVGEPGDPTGPWKFTVTLRDANRPATLVLTKTILLK